MRKKYKIDFKYNLNLYFSFLKKYKLMFIIILVLITLINLARLIEKLLFKLIIDRGTEFSANTLTSTKLINILIIVVIMYASSTNGPLNLEFFV